MDVKGSPWNYWCRYGSKWSEIWAQCGSMLSSVDTIHVQPDLKGPVDSTHVPKSARTVNGVWSERLACSTVQETVEKDVYPSLYLGKFLNFGHLPLNNPVPKIIIFSKILLLLLLLPFQIPAADCVGLSTHPSFWKLIVTLLEIFSVL